MLGPCGSQTRPIQSNVRRVCWTPEKLDKLPLVSVCRLVPFLVLAILTFEAAAVDIVAAALILYRIFLRRVKHQQNSVFKLLLGSR